MAMNVEGTLPEPAFVVGFFVLLVPVLFCVVGVIIIRRYTLESDDKKPGPLPPTSTPQTSLPMATLEPSDHRV